MIENDLDLVWAKANTDEIDGFYDSAFKATVSAVKRKSSADRTDAAIQQIYQSISRIIGIYGVEEDMEKVVIRYFSPESGHGVWTFDVRFSVRGESNQVLAAAMSLPDVADRVNKELKVFVKGMEIERG